MKCFIMDTSSSYGKGICSLYLLSFDYKESKWSRFISPISGSKIFQSFNQTINKTVVFSLEYALCRFQMNESKG